MRNEKQYIESVDVLNKIRNFQKSELNESEEKSESESYKGNDESVPYTQQDDVFGTSLQTCKTQFGADFSRCKTPMLYYPKDGDVVLSGEISRLGDAKFQFRLKDPSGYGCFVWTSPIQLSDENLNTLKVIYGVYKNWKNDLHKSDDNRPLSIKNKPNGPEEDGDDAEM